MNYKFFKIFLLFFLFSCANNNLNKKAPTFNNQNFFLNKGFTLVYNDDLYKSKIINKKIEPRSLIIFQKNLKPGTPVKITNLINSKNIIAKVGQRVEYPYFYNSIISKRISDELEIDPAEPYVEIKEILESNSFIIKKATTYEEEKNVADKAPVEEIKIKNLGSDESLKSATKIRNFNYLIKIADFYFEKSANLMKSRILSETTIKKINVDKLSSTTFRVFIGPYNNLNSLKKSFNAINVLEFDNIEIIKNN